MALSGALGQGEAAGRTVVAHDDLGLLFALGDQLAVVLLVLDASGAAQGEANSLTQGRLTGTVGAGHQGDRRGQVQAGAAQALEVLDEDVFEVHGVTPG